MDWTDMARNRDHWRAIVNTVMNLRDPQMVGKFLRGCTIGGFSKRAQPHEVTYRDRHMSTAILQEVCLSLSLYLIKSSKLCWNLLQTSFI
jgi:hypothetical protein